ncbi:MAG: TIGR01212 family radical SAM protein [Planctomycetota bacterium]|nr:MAG: TIGR01212 family radical SAM protein [Planctomycetota bacterium]
MSQPIGTLLSLAESLRNRYGRKLRRVMLDLGLSCPNRDGAKGFGGCVYCDVHGSGTGAQAEGQSLAEQWQRGLAKARRLQPEGPAAIAYLQSYSNTYPGLEPLKAALEFLAEQSQEAPILAIGTRPDCFSPEAADLLAAYRNRFDQVWLELGLETADDRVQALIGRHDSLEHFHRACHLARQRDLAVIAHTMTGLPGEKPDGLLRQVQEAAAAGVAGIKFHQLMVLRRTQLEAVWRRNGVALLTPEEYVERVADALEYLPADVVVHRLVAEAPEESYLAPQGWPHKNKVIHWIRQEMIRRQGWQGKRAVQLSPTRPF